MAVLALALAVALVATIVVGVRMKRSVRRRIDAAVAALGSGPLVETGGVHATLERLERQVEASAARDEASDASEHRMAQALTAIGDGIVVLDGDGRVVFSNDAGDRYRSARHGDALVGLAIEAAGEAALAGADTTRPVELFGPPKRDLVLSAGPLDDDGHRIGALVVIRDVTEHHRIDVVRRDFVANISHELKTPVGGLGVLAETLLGELESGDADPAVLARFAERMHHEAMRASRTIDDLLELARIEAGDIVGHTEVDIASVLAQAVARIEPAAVRRGIRIRVESPGVRPTVVGDGRQLVSAIANLLDNAVKYSPEDSIVVVGASFESPWLQLTVADEGIGIPKRDQERIFERFYRVDRARSRDTGGTGLGLSIVRHVAVNHGGRVEVHSIEGGGATFALVLPVSDAAGRRAPGGSDHVTPATGDPERDEAQLSETAPIDGPEVPTHG